MNRTSWFGVWLFAIVALTAGSGTVQAADPTIGTPGNGQKFKRGAQVPVAGSCPDATYVNVTPDWQSTSTPAIVTFSASPSASYTTLNSMGISSIVVPMTASLGNHTITVASFDSNGIQIGNTVSVTIKVEP